MTVKQATEFIDKWQPRLCPEWELEIKEGFAPDHAAEDVYASIDREADGTYLKATLYLGATTKDDKDLDAKRRKQILLHELLHCTLGDLKKAAIAPIKQLGSQEQELAANLIDWQAERAVDRLAVSFSEFA